MSISQSILATFWKFVWTKILSHQVDQTVFIKNKNLQLQIIIITLIWINSWNKALGLAKPSRVTCSIVSKCFNSATLLLSLGLELRRDVMTKKKGKYKHYEIFILFLFLQVASKRFIWQTWGLAFEYQAVSTTYDHFLSFDSHP